MTDIKSRLIDGMRGQAITLPNDEWLLLDDKNLTLIVERLLRTPGIAILEMPEGRVAADPITFSDTCCGKCSFGTCYVDQMTGA